MMTNREKILKTRAATQKKIDNRRAWYAEFNSSFAGKDLLAYMSSRKQTYISMSGQAASAEQKASYMDRVNEIDNIQSYINKFINPKS